MVAQTGFGKRLADRVRNKAEPKRKARETKEKLPEGTKRRQPGTNKPQNLNNWKQMRARQSKNNP